MSWAYTPRVQEGDGANRQLIGADLTYRYIPLESAAYNGLIWGTEVLYNRETFPFEEPAPEEPSFQRFQPVSLARPLQDEAGDQPPTTTVFERQGAFGMYSYLEAKLSRRYWVGFLYQYVQPLERQEGPTNSYSPYLTVWASEFQRLRAQYTYQDEPGNHENQFFLQWTWILGSHAHTFRDR